MSNDYSGTSTWRSVVRMPADGENRNATVLDRALEDLADRTAYLLATDTTSASLQLSSIAALKAVTSAIPSVRYVRGFGWYRYEPTYTFGTDVAPWFYRAAGLGSGAWVKCDWEALLGGDSARVQFAAALVPQTILGYGVETSSYAISATSAATSLSPNPLTDTHGDPLTSVSLDLLADTTVQLSAGPFWIVAPATYAGQIGLKAGAGNIFGVAEIPLAASSSVTLAAQYHTAVDASVSFSLCARVLGGNDPITVTAPADCQWLRYTILRTPT